ncbi:MULTISPECIES: Na(+)/H(+) antiporter subunit F1 [Alkalihalophilus]|jgi:multicomponent Na+:H+ antiporter subunit F|uniref:Na(+)/H(+) antiporter subunit F n=3 Tax=Alkalihalophilus TaxID=2893060 RepID=MRPF_ALKPO|nr:MULTISPECIES: Na(+)/H(+) antiporter subunit F1 [Alkalihalophilus]Q9RGZ0.1 RecName: Full=Na(+)/H(+) antiporter subunit F; AltName: Full=Mrp complex subunit F; AltName: Full=Multiple resistance and pH homeostasis protein F [Alkalihalophilus pseudofirmus OF4]7QRU_F Chain F, Na(+)/H(+) antiporter subunit F [Alkalihalophilus pseudofirmus]AAF21817.1 multiple resistance and pH regulation related protein F [Cytobacillus firmus]ABS70478.1 MrpF [synthetic construct]ADC50688.1 Mrp complex subunit F, s
MFQSILMIVLVVMSISLFVCFIRTLIGPTMSDRIVALDTFGINLIGFIGVIMMLQETLAYSEVVLVISILAFIGSIALSKFIERGVVFDRG